MERKAEVVESFSRVFFFFFPPFFPLRLSVTFLKLLLFETSAEALLSPFPLPLFQSACFFSTRCRSLSRRV